MSLTAGVWAISFVALALMSFRRPAWAVALYMLTFFAAPHMWWWGDEIPELRYAFISGFILLVTVALHRTTTTDDGGQRFGLPHMAAIGMAVNATFVNFALASAPAISFHAYVELVKFVVLFFLVWWAIQDKRDFRVVLIAVAIGAAYIGYEVTFNERGYFSGGRLEGVGAPGADSSNGLACLMLITLPLTGSLFVDSKRWEKLLVVISAPLALNVLLLCNSRGAFLGLIGAGVSFLLISRGAARKQAFKTLALGCAALFVLLGDPKILDRFGTTFVGSEDRDNSAASRVEFWKAGLAMLSDYPLGAGGNAFKYVHGNRYLAEITGTAEDKSLHNGYLTEATSWGIQGLFLHLLLFGSALTAAYRTSNRCRLEGRIDSALIGVCVMVSAMALLIHSVFGSFLGNEWGYWIVALLVRYSELYRPVEAVAGNVVEPVAA